MGRRRSSRNRDLPPNLYTKRQDGKVYYRYRHPQTGKFHALGLDKARAMQRARVLNSKLMDEDDAVGNILGAVSWDDMRDAFIEEWLHGRDYAEKTRKDYTRMMKDLCAELGRRGVRQTSVQHCAAYFDRFPPRASNERRKVAILFFKFARAKGWIDHNPAEATLPKVETVTRKRLTPEQFDAIYAEARRPIQNAMALSRKTLQARAEVARMKRSDYRDGVLKVIRGKTRKASEARAAKGLDASAFVAIHADAELERIIKRCFEGEKIKEGDVQTATRYLVHQPASANSKRRTKPLSPESISRGFQAAREAAMRKHPTLFAGLAENELPTFHEVRSLGAAELVRKLMSQGKDRKAAEAFAQRLLTHTTAKQTKLYLDGHEIEFVEVALGVLSE